MVAMVRVLPSREKAERIRELVDRGWLERDIVEKVFGEAAPEHTSAVRGLVKDPHAYHTDVDEVAVQRALQGDRAVWEGLTHYERQVVMLKIHERRLLEEIENESDAAQLRPHRGSASYKLPHDRMPEWLVVLGDRLGIEPRRLGSIAREFAEAREL